MSNVGSLVFALHRCDNHSNLGKRREIHDAAGLFCAAV